MAVRGRAVNGGVDVVTSPFGMLQRVEETGGVGVGGTGSTGGKHGGCADPTHCVTDTSETGRQRREKTCGVGRGGTGGTGGGAEPAHSVAGTLKAGG